MSEKIGYVKTEGGVTAAKGFEAAAAAAGIKYQGRTDMALIYSETPCRAAGTFTKNVVKAAPVKWDQKLVKESAGIHAVVVNSGIANACTGEEGMNCCQETAKAAADALKIPEDSVLVASTGVIGMQLPLDRLKEGIGLLKDAKEASLQAGTEASKAIMTTDTVNKEIAVQTVIGGKMVTIGGMSKGSGMIHPNMCTMLAFVTTDAAISREMLQKCVSADVEDTYNMISVDGDTSTNDTLLVLANGLAGNPEITEENEDYKAFAEALNEDTYNMISVDGDTSTNDTLLVLANGLAGNPEITEENEDYKAFAEALNAVNTFLARKMAGDGEGATALLEVHIVGAESKEQAVTLGKAVVSSSLVKAAVYGHDANWGRILCAMGYSGAEFDPECVDLFFESAAGRIQIVKNGAATDYDEKKASAILSEPEVTVTADIKMGSFEATAWGCDLTYDYVKINADYRS